VSTPIRFFFVLSVSVPFSYNSETHAVLICSKRRMWRMLVRTYLGVLCYFMENYICGVEKCCAIPWKLFFVDNFAFKSSARWSSWKEGDGTLVQHHG